MQSFDAAHQVPPLEPFRNARDAEEFLLVVFKLRDVAWHGLKLSEADATRLALQQASALRGRVTAHLPVEGNAGAESPAVSGQVHTSDQDEVSAAAPGAGDTVAFLERLKTRQLRPADMTRLAAAASRVLDAEDDRSLHDHLRLVSPGPRFRERLRNEHLAAAAACTVPDPLGASVTAAIFVDRWAQLVSRGEYARRSRSGAPSEHASRLEVHLFHASRLNGGEVLSAKQVYRLVGYLWQVATDKTPR